MSKIAASKRPRKAEQHDEKTARAALRAAFEEWFYHVMERYPRAAWPRYVAEILSATITATADSDAPDVVTLKAMAKVARPQTVVEEIAILRQDGTREVKRNVGFKADTAQYVAWIERILMKPAVKRPADAADLISARLRMSKLFGAPACDAVDAIHAVLARYPGSASKQASAPWCRAAVVEILRAYGASAQQARNDWNYYSKKAVGRKEKKR